MADGEADIDPDRPDLNQIQAERLAKIGAIMDAADQEMFTTLYHDRKRYLEMIVQIRRLYYVRIVFLCLTCFGLLLVILGVWWFIINDINHLKYLQNCKWSEWQDDLQKKVSYRSICGATQYGPLVCEIDCEIDVKNIYTNIKPPDPELDLYLTCSNNKTDPLYIKTNIK